MLLCQTTLPAQKGSGYAESSVLSSGKWFRIAITRDGVFRIDYSRLSALGLDNPAGVRIFANNAGQLSFFNDGTTPDDLSEIPVFVSAGSDGIFNQGDYLLFFGRSAHRWIYDYETGEYRFMRHQYSDTAFYFLTSSASPGKRITSDEINDTENFISRTTDANFVHEQEDVSLIKSGREWFQQISSSTPLNIDPRFENVHISEGIRFRMRIASRASGTTSVSLDEGSSVRAVIDAQGVNLGSSTGSYAYVASDTGSFVPSTDSPVFEIRYMNMGQSGAHGYLDYIQLCCRRSSIFSGNYMEFSDRKTIGTGRITKFTVRKIPTGALIWDVTDPGNVIQKTYERKADSAIFISSTDSLRSFIAFTPESFITPDIDDDPVENQDLHGSPPADLIIIAHPLFRKYAEELADIHRDNDGLKPLVVTPAEIYNEFSGGIPDIAAIRNFIRMKYLRQAGSAVPLKYLLLFGDGSYENRTPPPRNPAFIPTWQSQNSNIYMSSFTSDDFYGLLDEGEGESEGTVDIGIGRFPVSDTSQANTMLLKVRSYLDPAYMGDWRNMICLAADDEDGNAHLTDAEGLASVIEDYPAFRIRKIYLDSYRQASSVNGQSYPDVNKAITDRISEGCLVFNYTGHGNEASLAGENIIKPEELNSWNNIGRLPLFVTATCEFSRFDDADINISGTRTSRTSLGEKILLHPGGGGIALMSTTRLVYASPNYILNRNIFSCAFTRDSTGNPLSLGDIIRTAKNNSPQGINTRNFTLLGDPALKLAYPWHGSVVTDSINSVSVFEPTDSLKALSLITVAGHVEDPDENVMNSFNGIISPVVFDKAVKRMTLANDGGDRMEFREFANTLFRGKATVRNGRFRFTFIVPRDIDYTYGSGKISYYASDIEKDVNGGFTGFIVGGFSGEAIPDDEGPEIGLYMNDTLFRSGGITDENPRLLAVLSDPGGINATGWAPGHDITATLDNDRENEIILNNFYENDFESYRSGLIEYDLHSLEEGNHSITLKAWDNFNNSSELSLIFLVKTGGKFILRDLLNYPNPFTQETHITAEHNRPDESMSIEIRIYNMEGRIIRIINVTAEPEGYRIPDILWDGNDERGSRVTPGIYPYSVSVISGNGESARSSGRMIIL